MTYKNKEDKSIFDKKWKGQRTEFLNSYKAEKGCQLCGESNSICLDFHHLNDKGGTVSHMRTCSIKRLMTEIGKCIVVCANCHRKIHA